MSQELKPCPFCSGAARIESNRDWHRLDANHDDDCILSNGTPVVVYPAQPRYLEQMVSEWNRRAAPAEVDAEGLPPLPAPDVNELEPYGPPTAYSVAKVRQAQREAIAADRRARVES